MDVKEKQQESVETAATVPTFLRSLEEPQRSINPASRGTNAVGAKEVLVWWDIETCPITSSVAASSLVQELRKQSGASNDICVTINVYGNAGPDSKAPLDALVAGGITLQHRILPCKQPGSESAAVKTMLVDMALWALATPAPGADVFLVSAARDAGLRELVSGLHLRGYAVHVATRLAFGEEERLFRPMPRHWSVSKQLFVARAVEIPEQLAQLHLHS